MRLMVQVEGCWVCGIAEWTGTWAQTMVRRGWEKQGYATRMEQA